MALDDIKSYTEAIELLKTLRGWNDSKQLIERCQKEIENLRIKASEQEDEYERDEKNKRIANIVLIGLGLGIALFAFMAIVISSL